MRILPNREWIQTLKPPPKNLLQRDLLTIMFNAQLLNPSFVSKKLILISEA